MQCISFNVFERGSMVGLGNFVLEKLGVRIDHVALFCKNGKYWASMPSYRQSDYGDQRFCPYFLFLDQEKQKTFLARAAEMMQGELQKRKQETPQHQTPPFSDTNPNLTSNEGPPLPEELPF